MVGDHLKRTVALFVSGLAIRGVITGYSMVKWLLVCPHCDHKFAHTQINDKAVEEAYLHSYGADAKPNISEKRLTCPFCQMEFLYGRFHLICEDDSDQRAKGKDA
jgi:hypothetical protein